MALNPNVSCTSGDLDDVVVLSDTAPPHDGPVWMATLMQHRDADHVDGRPSPNWPDVDRVDEMMTACTETGAELVFLARVDAQLLGVEPRWDGVAVVKHPSRRAFEGPSVRPMNEEEHIAGNDGIERAITMCTHPMSWPALPNDAPDWSDVPHPPTEGDGPVVVLHVIRFNDGRADTDMVSYQNTAGRTAVPHGLRIAAWLEVEETVLGDGRSWDQVRFNAFPSKQAFMAVALDPRRLDAQAKHRDTAIADTYTMILRPIIDRLHQSLDLTHDDAACRTTWVSSRGRAPSHRLRTSRPSRREL
jgi:hypothetical protein